MTKLFVGNLPFSTTAADLRKLFEECGKFSVEILQDKRTKKSRGIAFVTFDEEEKAETALKMNGILFEGRVLKIRKYEKKTMRQKSEIRQKRLGNKICFGYPLNQQIYVGNIGNLGEVEIGGIFLPFGEIAQVDIMRDRRTGYSRGFGFVIFHDPIAATAALELNNSEFLGQKIKVSPARIKRNYPKGPVYPQSECSSTEHSPMLHQWPNYPVPPGYSHHQGPMGFVNDGYPGPEMPPEGGIMPMAGGIAMPPPPMYPRPPQGMGSTTPPPGDHQAANDSYHFVMGEKLGEPAYLMQQPPDLPGLIAGFGNLHFQGDFTNPHNVHKSRGIDRVDTQHKR